MKRKEEVELALSKRPETRPLLHPAMAGRFAQAVKDLRKALNAKSSRNEAAQHLRGLVDKIVLTPKAGEKGLSIDLYGDLAGILNMASGGKDMKGIERLQHLPANDNNAEAFQDKIGSGGWLPTVSTVSHCL